MTIYKLLLRGIENISLHEVTLEIQTEDNA